MDTNRLILDTYQSVISLLLIAVIFIPLEYFFPLIKAQKLIRKGWTADLLHKMIGFILIIDIAAAIYAISAYLIQYLLVFLAERNFTYLGIALHHIQTFVSGQPYALQLFELVVVGDLVYYFCHRLFHRIPILWRLHAIHHSAEELDWLVAYRFHPLDQGIINGIGSVVFGLLGFNAQQILLVIILSNLVDPLIHSNIKIRFGFLEKIIATPFFHHWHHTNERAHFDKNFAGRFPIIDMIFGSYYSPERRTVGLGISTPVPVTYFGQLLAPFLPNKWKIKLFKREDLFISIIVEPPVSSQAEPVSEEMPQTSSTV